MLRWIATLAIGALFALNLALPSTSIGRRGPEALVRQEVAGVAAQVGRTLPDFTLQDIEGETVRLTDLRGHRVLLTFERSVDW